ncbi:7420_t:CDS:1, partial [Acaulospora colombiana]
RKKLRLVCRTWKEFLDRHSLRWVFLKSQTKVMGSGTQRIDFTTSEGIEYLPQESRFHTETSRSQTSNISVLYIQDPSNDGSVLYKSAEKIPHVRSIGFSCEFGQSVRGIPQSFVEGLQSSFTQLTCLAIWAGVVEGPLVLPNLEVLSLNVTEFPIQEWWFPSLKHYHFKARRRVVENFSASMVPGPTTRLLSLYLFDPDKSIEVDEQFWEDFPSLQFLGIFLGSLDLVADPPHTHPLSQLFLCECITNLYGSSINYRQLAAVVARITNLTTLVVPAECFIYEGEDALPLSKAHAERGIEWIDMYGGELLQHESAVNSNVGFALATLVGASLVAQHMYG